jgi:hypothetical protein
MASMPESIESEIELPDGMVSLSLADFAGVGDNGESAASKRAVNDKKGAAMNTVLNDPFALPDITESPAVQPLDVGTPDPTKFDPFAGRVQHVVPNLADLDDFSDPFGSTPMVAFVEPIEPPSADDSFNAFGATELTPAAASVPAAAVVNENEDSDWDADFTTASASGLQVPTTSLVNDAAFNVAAQAESGWTAAVTATTDAYDAQQELSGEDDAWATEFASASNVASAPVPVLVSTVSTERGSDAEAVASISNTLFSEEADAWASKFTSAVTVPVLPTSVDNRSPAVEPMAAAAESDDDEDWDHTFAAAPVPVHPSPSTNDQSGNLPPMTSATDVENDWGDEFVAASALPLAIPPVSLDLLPKATSPVCNEDDSEWGDAFESAAPSGPVLAEGYVDRSSAVSVSALVVPDAFQFVGLRQLETHSASASDMAPASAVVKPVVQTSSTESAEGESDWANNFASAAPVLPCALAPEVMNKPTDIQVSSIASDEEAWSESFVSASDALTVPSALANAQISSGQIEVDPKEWDGAFVSAGPAIAQTASLPGPSMMASSAAPAPQSDDDEWGDTFATAPLTTIKPTASVDLTALTSPPKDDGEEWDGEFASAAPMATPNVLMTSAPARFSAESHTFSAPTAAQTTEEDDWSDDFAAAPPTAPIVSVAAAASAPTIVMHREKAKGANLFAGFAMDAFQNAVLKPHVDDAKNVVAPAAAQLQPSAPVSATVPISAQPSAHADMGPTVVSAISPSEVKLSQDDGDDWGDGFVAAEPFMHIPSPSHPPMETAKPTTAALSASVSISDAFSSEFSMGNPGASTFSLTKNDEDDWGGDATFTSAPLTSGPVSVPILATATTAQHTATQSMHAPVFHSAPMGGQHPRMTGQYPGVAAPSAAYVTGPVGMGLQAFGSPYMAANMGIQPMSSPPYQPYAPVNAYSGMGMPVASGFVPGYGMGVPPSPYYNGINGVGYPPQMIVQSHMQTQPASRQQNSTSNDDEWAGQEFSHA